MIIIIAYYSCTESKNQLKIANYLTSAKKTLAILTASASLNALYKATVTETTPNPAYV